MDKGCTIRQRRLVQLIACALAAAPLAVFAPSALAQNVDLGNLGDRGFRIDGAGANDTSGHSVSGAGDVNGDGLSDLIIGAPRADRGASTDAGRSFVVFGKASSTPVDLKNLGTGGFVIAGIDAGDLSGFSVSGAGDVNGDGLADLIVGAYGADPGGDSSAGESYVVFGKASTGPVDVADLGSGGFRIDGINPSDLSGGSVSGAGDVNGDGLADLIISSILANPAGSSATGASYVVFGKLSSSPVDLSELGAGGFVIEGIDGGDRSGFSVSGAGDVNGDGLADLVVGAPLAGVGSAGTGEVYVVFGKNNTAAVELANLERGGFQIDGIDYNDFTGGSVSGAGDVNGDGLADLTIGAPLVYPIYAPYAGESYVVFGKASVGRVDLADLGTSGFYVNAVSGWANAVRSVSGAGDVNGDGLADLVMGAGAAAPSGSMFEGESYVVFGKASTSPVELISLGTQGFRIGGAGAGELSGFSVSGAGDVNGDGLADLVIGAPSAAVGGNVGAGASYVVFSVAEPSASIVVRTHSANGSPARTAFGIAGEGSNHSTPDARAWIDFADGADPSAAASLDTVTLYRSAATVPSPGANVSWRIETTRQEWTSAQVRFRYVDSELVASENQLRVIYSPTGDAPFTMLRSVVNPMNNTITATITQPGFFFLGAPEIFADGFEPAPAPPASP